MFEAKWPSTVLECISDPVSPGAVIGPADLFLLCRNVFALPTTPPPPEAPEAEAEVVADDESTPPPAATLAAAAAIMRAFLSFSPLLGLCSVDVRCHIFVFSSSSSVSVSPTLVSRIHASAFFTCITSALYSSRLTRGLLSKRQTPCNFASSLFKVIFTHAFHRHL